MVFDKVKRKFLKLWTRFNSSTRQIQSDERLRHYQTYFTQLQDIILWESPRNSLVSLFVISAVFGYLSSCKLPFYGVIFGGLLLFVLYELWTEHIWPEIRVKKRDETQEVSQPISVPQGRLSLSEANQHLSCLRAAVSKQYKALQQLRVQQPVVYCAIVFGICILTAGIGSALSLLTLIYLIILALFTLPGAYIHLLSPELKSQLGSYVAQGKNIICPTESSVSFDEFLPESNKENLALFAEAAEFKSTVDGASSSSSEECLMVMPSHDESSMDAADSLSLDPSSLEKLDPTVDDEEAYLLPDTAGAPEIRFRKTHFNGSKSAKLSRSSSTSSSASLPEQLTSDMNFPDIEETLGPILPTALSAISSNLSKLTSNMFGKPSTEIPHQPLEEEDSDSEFEIIGRDEVLEK